MSKIGRKVNPKRPGTPIVSPAALGAVTITNTEESFLHIDRSQLDFQEIEDQQYQVALKSHHQVSNTQHPPFSRQSIPHLLYLLILLVCRLVILMELPLQISWRLLALQAGMES